ncbi:MAG: glycosyltransferase family 4 protein, partial [Synechococcaceae bacterium WB4_1_0192]|nr:glycosyltransferase family 4 protein [Synechococcaceae bacterium WB4_1_0192]
LLDTVRCLDSGCEDPTGLLFPEQSAGSLTAALMHFDQGQLWRRLPAERQRLWAEQFSPQRFRERLSQQIEQAWQAHQLRLHRRSRSLSVPLR